MVKEIRSIDHIIVHSEIEAFLLEANLIKKNKPIYNIKLADDKFFPYLKIGSDPQPYVTISRTLNDQTALYLGPYTSRTDLEIVLKILRRIFPFQSIKNHPKGRCLYYHIGLCPCVTYYPDKMPEYKKNINRLVKFMNGDKDKVVKSLVQEQKGFITNEEFEKAAEIQVKIEKINAITSDHFDPFAYQQKPDLYFDRIKTEVKSLKEILIKYGIDGGDLTRIECYDISNISGKQATGSMVVFINGEALTSEYRRFKIKLKNTPDDFAMHREVAKRRMKRPDWDKPDLMVIDGGKGQVSSVLQMAAVNHWTVPIIGLAKREEIIVIPIKTGSGLDFLEVNLPNSTPGINLLRRIRDEAHRFAITYHRLLRRKALNI